MTLSGSQSVTSLPTSEITHTFTVPGLSLNLPMASDSTIVAYFKTGAAGSFVWLCESACGSGADGSQGAMITPGWMTGAITVG
jgi:heme/copper-type cytochrome/quinol oxidase subunit 2